MMRKLAALIFIALTAAAGPALAQEPRAGATLIPYDDPTALYRVDSGLYQIEEGQVIELGDRYVTMIFETYKADKQQVYVTLNGKRISNDANTWYWRTGSRKTLNAEGSVYADKRFCALDYINYIGVKGGADSAVFRFRCE